MLSIRRIDSSNSNPGQSSGIFLSTTSRKFLYLSLNLEIHSSLLFAALASFQLIYSVSDLVPMISFLRLRPVQPQLTQATLGRHRQHFTSDNVIDVAQNAHLWPHFLHLAVKLCRAC